MKIKWGVLLRWALVVVAIILSTLAAAVFLELSALIQRLAFRVSAALHFNKAPSLFLAPVDHLVFFCGILLWVIPPALAIAFALRARLVSGWQWGVLVSLALFGLFLWHRPQTGHEAASRWAIAIAGCILLTECLVWIRKLVRREVAMLGQLAALLVLFVPSAVSFLSAANLPPAPRKVWSVVLQNGTWQAMNTGSDFAATRQMVVAGDRVLAVFDAGSAGYQGKEPMSHYRVLSLDRKTGALKNQLEFTGRWGAMPYLFLNRDGHVILENGNLHVLNPDLTATGVTYSPDQGRVVEISPDGTTLAWETMPGTTLMDATTLKQIGTLSESAPATVSREAVLSNNTTNPRKFPNQLLITKTDRSGSRTIFHGPCGGIPEFLTSDRVLLVGCGWIKILDSNGKTVAERQDDEGAYNFAGVSQNGKRFALEARDERGDPSELIYERFYVYDSDTAAALATIPVTNLPERQSWTAFSADAHFFAVGNPNQVTLYKLP